MGVVSSVKSNRSVVRRFANGLAFYVRLFYAYSGMLWVNFICTLIIVLLLFLLPLLLNAFLLHGFPFVAFTVTCSLNLHKLNLCLSQCT